MYINSYLLIINFTEGKMLRFNTITNDVTRSYPHDYSFGSGLRPTFNETIDGDLITIGGFNNNGSYSCKVNIYNINTDLWSEGKSLPYGVCGNATWIVNEDIYVFGGFNTDGGINCGDIAKVIRYRGGEWNNVTNLLY